MHEIDSVIELAGLIVSASGCSCLIILFAHWLNGVYVAHMQKRYILALRMRYEILRPARGGRDTASIEAERE